MKKTLRSLKKFYYSLLMIDTRIKNICSCCFQDDGNHIGFFKTETTDGHSITFDFYSVEKGKKVSICNSYYVVANVADIFPAKIRIYNKKKLITLTIFLRTPKTDLIAELLLDKYLNVMLESVVELD